MQIREKEDLLFERWRRKYVRRSFLVDGCPSPVQYQGQDRKVIFVLKDPNMGTAGQPGDVYDQRYELANDPHPWWAVVARWCHFIRYPTDSWANALCTIDSGNAIKEALSRHCFVQLKKSWGTGSIANDELHRVVQDDRDEILEQLAIYTPDFIICCGNAEQLGVVFGCQCSTRQMTKDGVGYWIVTLDGRRTTIVDFCHPSIRIGTKVNGMIARGLAAALEEIAKSSARPGAVTRALGEGHVE